MENYAIRRLQEQFITQVAAQVLFEEGVKYMEQEMDEIGGGKNLWFHEVTVCLFLRPTRKDRESSERASTLRNRVPNEINER